MRDRKSKKESEENKSTGRNSKEKYKITFDQCEHPGHAHVNCPLKIYPVCGDRGHATNQWGTDSKVLALPNPKNLRDDEEMGLAGMVSVGGASGDSTKVAENSSKGMSESGSRVCDAIAGCHTMPPIDRALLVDDAGDAYSADPSKWRSIQARVVVPVLPGTGIWARQGICVILTKACTSLSLARV